MVLQMAKVFGVLFTAIFAVMTSTGWADDAVYQFELSNQNATLTPDQVKAVKENLLDKGYSLGATPTTDKNGQQNGVRFVIGKTLPQGVTALTKAETVPTLGMVLLSAPQDKELAASVQKYVDNVLTNMPSQEDNPIAQQLDQMVHGIRRLAILFQIADLSALQSGQEGAQRFFQQWGEFAEWADVNNIQNNHFKDHHWKLNEQGDPTLYLPNAQPISWSKLKEMGVDGPGHKMPSNWSYKAKGFVNKSQKPASEQVNTGKKNEKRPVSNNGNNQQR